MRPPGRSSPPFRRGFGAAAGLALGLAVAVAGCGGHHGSVSSGPTTRPTTPTTAPPTTAPATTVARLPTVPNCGGGAYKPATLLIVCGVGSTMATGVSWQSWDPTGATGTATVHLTSGGTTKTAPAQLALGTVVRGGTGPQFSVLTVTWAGPSPDGHPTDTFHLTLSS